MMLPIFSFIIQYRIPLTIIAAIIAAYGYGAYQHNAGYYKGYAACDNAYIAAKEVAKDKSANTREETEHETRSMDDTDVLNDLRNHDELRRAEDI